MSKKLSKSRKRYLRAAVLDYMADKLSSHTSYIDVPGADLGAEQEFVKEYLQAEQQELRDRAQRLLSSVGRSIPYSPPNAVPITKADRDFSDSKRPGIAEIRDRLRQEGVPEEDIDWRAKETWEHENRGGPAPRTE